MKSIKFTDVDGRVCISNGPVPISRCVGICDSYDSSIFYGGDDDDLVSVNR